MFLFLFLINVHAYECQPYVTCFHGHCVQDELNNTYCECAIGYGTSTAQKKYDIYCNSEQKNAITAFLLELIFPMFGAGYMYIDQYDLAFGQIIYYLGILLLLCYIIGNISSEHTHSSDVSDSVRASTAHNVPLSQSITLLEVEHSDNDIEMTEINTQNERSNKHNKEANNSNIFVMSEALIYIFIVSWFIGGLVWWIYSVNQLVHGDITDGNGVSLNTL
jgi:hypothetical protein